MYFQNSTFLGVEASRVSKFSVTRIAAGGQAFDFVGISQCGGYPILSRTVRKGGKQRLGFLIPGFQSLKSKDRCPHPCKERKDRAPSVVVFSGKKGPATRPLEC